MPPLIRASALRPVLQSTLQLQLRQLATRRASRSAPTPPPAAPPKPPRSLTGAYLTLAVFFAGSAIAFAYKMQEDEKMLAPYSYTQHRVGANTLLTPQHALLRVPLTPDEERLFDNLPNLVTVHHVMLGAPQIQIERPYTPINDGRLGDLELVVKRVPGGEVGRLAHSLKPGAEVAMRGPLQTFNLDQSQYDTVVMISTGTAVAPFLQLLSKAHPANTNFRLLHALPNPGKEDWATRFLEPLQAKWGDQLHVQRIPPGAVAKSDVQAALKDAGRVLVLVCLPPTLMQPLCGYLTPTLQQGPLTGLLRDIGLRPDQVKKLE
ncbi:NADH-cytochrome b5 reductase 2 [Vanrija pseudolonga]|uniref:NADH-cytochrome b5 reductase 2 n=1 Tax=Vanrija pseudolonga TaxID=143232 RepID=A0AAF0XZ29_9TREE|nr:NADH-cytochrome b5 reductase 2 [Vanrija pseudolonga]